MLNYNEDPNLPILVDQMAGFLDSTNGISWAAIIKPDGKPHELIKMDGRPCYGEMRRYGSSSTRPGDYKPGDLPNPIPEGVREAVGLSLYPRQRKNGEKDDKILARDRLTRWLFSPDSPWHQETDPNSIHATSNLKSEHGVMYTSSIIITDTDIDPTLLVSSFMNQRNFSYDRALAWCNLVDKYGVDGRTAFVLTFWCQWSPDLKTFGPKFSLAYYLPKKLDLKRFYSGEYRELSNGRTWREQEDYNRPDLAELFSDPEAPKATGEVFADILGIEYNDYMGSKIEQPADNIKKLIEYLDGIREGARDAA